MSERIHRKPSIAELQAINAGLRGQLALSRKNSRLKDDLASAQIAAAQPTVDAQPATAPSATQVDSSLRRDRTGESGVAAGLAQDLSVLRKGRNKGRTRNAGAFAGVAVASILATAFVLGEFGGGRGTDGVKPASSPNGAAMESATPSTGGAVGTPNPGEAAGTPNPSTEVKTEVNLIKIESVQAAVTRFGADAYSRNPSNWEINEWGGAHLKETAKTVKVNTAGAVLEGWIKANMAGARDALTVVADSNVSVVEVNGGTFWDFGTDSRAGFTQVLGQVRAKEAVEQPDVTIVPLCADLTPINTTDVFVNKVESAQQAALMFGADAYSRNPSNWEINEWGGAHLKETNAASLVNLNGAVLEGWIKANRENGRDAITFVTHPNVSQMRTNGGTLWNFADSNRGFQQLLGQVIAREAVEQPDVTVLPAYDCAITR